MEQDKTRLSFRLSAATTQLVWAVGSTGTSSEPVACSDTGWALQGGGGLQRVVTGRQFPARELGSKLSRHLLVASLLAPPQLPLWLVFFVCHQGSFKWVAL